MGSGDQFVAPVSPIDSNNNRASKVENIPHQLAAFNISPPDSEQDSDSDQQLSPPDSPPPTTKVCDLLRPENAQEESLETFERLRSRSEGSLIRKPKKGCLLNKNGDLKPKLPRHVSFADASGYALEQIRIFDVQPLSISDFVDSDDNLDDDFFVAKKKFSVPTNCSSIRARNERRFVPYFTLPWSESGKQKLLLSTVEERKICLESISINSPWRITGTILVKNLCFHKNIFVRQTLDKWQTYKDIQAEYVSAVSPDIDRFKFDLRFAFKMTAGTRLEMALGFEQGDSLVQHWDNNCDFNYAFWYNDKI